MLTSVVSTVNPQLAMGRRFAMRNEHRLLCEGGQTAYATVNLGWNYDPAGQNPLGREGEGVSLQCRMSVGKA